MYRTVRGMRDFLPADLAKRRFVEEKVRECFNLYGYDEVETPILESFDLISAKAGDEIRHRMYSFKDLGGRMVALRPEITPSIARVVANKLRTEVKPLKLGYIANCFRYDNPQMGRYREFWQAGFELFGSSHPVADAEVLAANNALMRRLGFTDFSIKIGHVAILRDVFTEESMTEADQNRLMEFMDKREQTKVFRLLSNLQVSDGCQTTMKELFTLRGTDWKRLLGKGRRILQHKEGALVALDHLEAIIGFARSLGVETEFFLDLGFARGLEYYTGMIFEVYVPGLDIALGGGGRYDRLVELFGGEPIPAVGCAPGIDRIALALEKKGLFPEQLTHVEKVLVIAIQEDLLPTALELASDLRKQGVAAHNEVTGRSLGSALSYADKKNYRYAVIVGSAELEKECVILRDLKAETQREVPITHLFTEIGQS
ncbi:MAG: histidine--tRNA ligase [Candidatus Bathyarchaeota archaeon]|nr:histidine--tRNA ligase [Candidatus Bathyarchaeota archaeon]